MHLTSTIKSRNKVAANKKKVITLMNKLLKYTSY
ncbi:hypothetical protein TcasGA2_TC031618 [Tribolium castaneum]|uniref:Uncharacterized protein n=1 Tax=Tribolium castaneum TaxID=7070 RepID=A0A139WAH3_TRICA|nr:hypothetical protein TcasGA2_TC031618 [Tribolium castaneum]